MDDWAQYLEGEQRNANGLLLEVLASGYEEWDYIAAVEGPLDRLFYFDFVEDALSGRSTHFLSCGGKEALLGFKLLVEGYDWINPPRFLYLCDKDFDEFIGNKSLGVWYTDHYSIESYIANRDFVKYVVKKYASKAIKTAELVAFMRLFDGHLSYMVSHLRGYSAFMCEIRASGEHPCFDDFGIDCLFDLSQPRPTKESSRADRAARVLRLRKRPEVRNLAARARTFKVNKFGDWLRGKLALQLVRKAYDYAQKSSPSDVKGRLPGSSYFGSDALANAFSFMGPIPSLKLYCHTVN